MPDLYIWSATRPVDMAPLKAAKLSLPVDEVIRPLYPQAPEDLPDLETRVLAIGSRPPFLCHHALVTPRTSMGGWVRALSWTLGITEHDEKATLIVDTLTAAFGPGVREVPPEEIEGMQRLRDYLQNRV
jgi:hypothetical protein